MENPTLLTRNDPGGRIRGAMILQLNRQLADTLDLGLQAKQAHWNVKGPNFIALHQLFDHVAETVAEFADALAERAVALGGPALGTLQIVAGNSRLPAYPTEITAGRAHVAALAVSLLTLGATTRASIDPAAQAGDAGTADLFTEVSRGLDKLLWMVEAHQQSAE
jgi:starvation-inducible DNA-binding protein